MDPIVQADDNDDATSAVKLALAAAWLGLYLGWRALEPLSGYRLGVAVLSGVAFGIGYRRRGGGSALKQALRAVSIGLGVSSLLVGAVIAIDVALQSH